MIEEDSYSSDEGSSDDLEEERADKVKKLDEDIRALKSTIAGTQFSVTPLQGSNQRNVKERAISDDVSASGRSRTSSRRSSKFGGAGDRDTTMLKDYTDMINSVQNGLKKVDGCLKK